MEVCHLGGFQAVHLCAAGHKLQRVSSNLCHFTVAEVSKPHTEAVLRQDLMAPTAPDLFLDSPKPTSMWTSASHPPRECWGRGAGSSPSSRPERRGRIQHRRLPAGAGGPGRAGPGAAPTLQPPPLLPWHSSTTKVMRLSILADLHVEMNPEGNLELVTSACKTTVEEAQSTEEVERSAPRFSMLWDLGNGGKEETEARAFLGRKICLEVSKLLLSPNERLISLTAQFPITPSCQVQYLPLAAPMVSEQGITISLQTTFQVAGMAIPLPVSPVPFSMPEPVSSSPSHLTLAFSEHFYTSLFFALELAGAFNMTIPVSRASKEKAPARIRMQHSAHRRVRAAEPQSSSPEQPSMGSLFQEDLPVVLRAVFRSSPQVVLEEGKAALKLFLTIHVGAGSPAFQSFLSVNAVSAPCKRAERGEHGERAECALRVCRVCSVGVGSTGSVLSVPCECAECVLWGARRRWQHTDGFIASPYSKLKQDHLLTPILPSLFPLQDMSAGLLLSVADTRMMISAAATEDTELSLAASDVGPVPAAVLEELFLPTIRAEVPAQMNVVLSGGVFLPHISGFTYTDVNVAIHKVTNKTFKLLPAMFGLKGTREQC
ncbi:protein TENP-like [Theristicus caerulescens]